MVLFKITWALGPRRKLAQFAVLCLLLPSGGRLWKGQKRRLGVRALLLKSQAQPSCEHTPPFPLGGGIVPDDLTTNKYFP